MCTVWGVGSREAHVPELSAMYSTAEAAPISSRNINSQWDLWINRSTDQCYACSPPRREIQKYMAIIGVHQWTILCVQWLNVKNKSHKLFQKVIRNQWLFSQRSYSTMYMSRKAFPGGLNRILPPLHVEPNNGFCTNLTLEIYSVQFCDCLFNSSDAEEW